MIENFSELDPDDQHRIETFGDIGADTKPGPVPNKDDVLLIGIDPGVHTGLATVLGGKLDAVCTLSAVQAEIFVLSCSMQKNIKILVYVEDARRRIWFGSRGKEALQGVGSIKRDCHRWEEFLTFHKIEFELVSPKNNMTKIKQASFQEITGYQGRTSEHGRDAAMMVWTRRKWRERRSVENGG